jgi:hypothetical protein
MRDGLVDHEWPLAKVMTRNNPVLSGSVFLPEGGEGLPEFCVEVWRKSRSQRDLQGLNHRFEIVNLKRGEESVGSGSRLTFAACYKDAAQGESWRGLWRVVGEGIPRCASE